MGVSIIDRTSDIHRSVRLLPTLAAFCPDGKQVPINPKPYRLGFFKKKKKISFLYENVRLLCDFLLPRALTQLVSSPTQQTSVEMSGSSMMPLLTTPG